MVKFPIDQPNLELYVFIRYLDLWKERNCHSGQKLQIAINILFLSLKIQTSHPLLPNGSINISNMGIYSACYLII